MSPADRSSNPRPALRSAACPLQPPELLEAPLVSRFVVCPPLGRLRRALGMFSNLEVVNHTPKRPIA
jgi:hypothetical protein